LSFCDAVIVNYHTERLIAPLLEDLAGEGPYCRRVYVVDNSGTFSLSGRGPDLEIINPGKNLGYGRAVNLAARSSTAPYLLVLNPDLRLFPGALEALLKAAIKTGAALLGPRFYWDTNRLFRLPPFAGETLNWVAFAKVFSPADAIQLSFYWRLRHERFWREKEPFFEPFLCGAAILVNRKFFPEEIFDPRFFLYYEDTDLSFSALLKGHLLLCVPQAEMVHFWNQSPSPPEGKKELMSQAGRLFFRKHYPLITRKLVSFLSRLERPAESRFPFLGGFSSPPVLPAVLGCWFEIALNPSFVPFAQTSFPLLGEEFSFPAEIWERVPQGRFFVRLVDKAGVVKKAYSFEKKRP